MGEYVYVDNSNLFIEARRVSAVQKGYAPDIWVAMQNRITDNDYSIDFGRLHEFIAGGHQAGRTVRVTPTTKRFNLDVCDESRI